MGIELKIYQEKSNGLGEDRSVLAASGEIKVKDAIIWLVKDYSPGHLANHVSGSVNVIEKNRLVISHTYYTGQFIDGVVETGSIEDWNHYSWTYEFTGIIQPTPMHPLFQREFESYSPEFDQLRVLIWTIAKAWSQEYPEALGTVIGQLIALEDDHLENYRSIGSIDIKF